MVICNGSPLLQLYWWGKLFPCCEKEEDRSARHSLAQLEATGQRIRWHTGGGGGRAVKAAAAAAVSMVSSFFSPSKSTNSKSPVAAAAEAAGGGIIEAQWKLVDNDDGIPEIQIIPLNNNDNNSFDFTDDNSEGSGSNTNDGSSHGSVRGGKDDKILRIPLKRVTHVQAVEKDIIVLLPADISAAAASNPNNGKSVPKRKELVRFQVEEQERNNFIHNLHVIMEWDRQRRLNVGELEYEETSIASRAKKVTHFAKRELEMKQTKREREKRKEKYIAESGGLKYTAIAMANKA